MPPFTPEEKTLLPDVRAFMDATGYGKGIPYSEAGEIALIRLIMRHLNVEQLQRLTELYDSPAGEHVRRAKLLLVDDSREAMKKAMNLRISIGPNVQRHRADSRTN